MRVQDAFMTVCRLNADELACKLSKAAASTIIDVRPQNQFDMAHLTGESGALAVHCALPTTQLCAFGPGICDRQDLDM